MKIYNYDVYKTHMKHTVLFKYFKYHSGIYIVRSFERDAFWGNNIMLISNHMEYEKTKTSFNDIKAIVTEYIQNPLLFNNKKFHIRMYMLININKIGLNYIKDFHLFNKGIIMTAKDKFKLSDFWDYNIHDTHLKSTDGNYFYPDDLLNKTDLIDKIHSQMYNICKALFMIVKNDICVYKESDNAFEIFGIDFMLDDTYNVFLIEVNVKVGYKPCLKDGISIYCDRFNNFVVEYFNWLYNSAIKDIT